VNETFTTVIAAPRRRVPEDERFEAGQRPMWVEAL
jgi:hypothetical protein